MKFTAAFLAAIVVVATSQTASGQTVTPQLSANGVGPWRVSCDVIADGSPTTVILESGAESFVHRSLSKGKCDYRAGSRGDLTISLAGADV